MKRQEAIRYRYALQQLRGRILDEENMPEDISKAPRCDLIETRSVGLKGKEVLLCLSCKGEVVATFPITKRDLARIKSELGYWNQISSGSAMASRHGNFVEGKA